MPTEAPAPSIADYLCEPPQIAAPDVVGALAVFPLIGPLPERECLSFARAQALGAKVTELPGGASVNDLLVVNPTPHAVLLYEGEEVLGAQQNRTFDVSVLVAPRSKIQVPVSCVEAGRWDGTRHGEAFSPAPQTAYPSLRRLKNERATRAAETQMTPRADQGEVWQEVARAAAAHDALSPTGAMHDVYDRHRGRLAAMCEPIHLRCSQTGMLVAIGGRFVVLDRISQPDALEPLFGPLIQGYALDARRVDDCAPPTREHAHAALEQVLAARLRERDAIGLGRDARLTQPGVSGAGLIWGEEIVALSAFFVDEEGTHDTQQQAAAPAARVTRPSRPRPR
jgi:hypothetical protein